jgi:hypothetical protein
VKNALCRTWFRSGTELQVFADSSGRHSLYKLETGTFAAIATASRIRSTPATY